MIEINNKEELFREIGRQGDALWEGQLERDADGCYVDIRDAPPEDDYGPFRVIAIAMGLVVASVLWRLERLALGLLGRSYFCPLCHNPMKEPLVFCPNCKRVQSRLRPTPAGVFARQCRCGTRRWPVLGSLWAPPQPFVCRDTETFKGCYTPHRLPDLAGRYRSAHVAVLGSTVGAKHAFMSYLLVHLAQRYSPAWTMSELELLLFRAVLAKGLEEDTTRFETPGRVYTLARTFILHGRRKTLWVFHNLLNTWLSSEEELHRNCPAWTSVGSLIIVLDGKRLVQPKPDSGDPPAELFTRAFRDIEKFCLLPPDRPLPMRVAVVIASPSNGALLELIGGSGNHGTAQFKRVVMDREPALHALLARTVNPTRLRFWGWVARSRNDQSSPTTAQEVGQWVLPR